MKNIVIFGAPGAGKGTQSDKMIEKYGLGHISTGDVLRNEIKNGTELGKTAKGYIDNGQLIPDELMIDILASVYDSFGKGFFGVVHTKGFQTGESFLIRRSGGDIFAPLDLIAFSLQAEQQIFKVGGGRDQPVNGRFQFRLVAGSGLGCLVFDVTFALVLPWDDDRQPMFFAKAVAGTADIVVTPLVGMVVLVIREADRIENQVVMNMPLVYVGGQDRFILAAQDFLCKLHPDLMGFLRRHLPRLKRLDQMAAQVGSLVDGMAAGPGKFDIRSFGGAAIGGHQQLSIRLFRVTDIVDGCFQR